MTVDKKQSTPSEHEEYNELVRRVREASLLGGTAELLGWDREVMMPDGGLQYRSNQLAQLARLQHETFTSPRVGELLGECETDSQLMSDPLCNEAVNVREIRRSYDRQTKLPAELVQQEAELGSYAQHEWAMAQKQRLQTLSAVVGTVGRAATAQSEVLRLGQRR